MSHAARLSSAVMQQRASPRAKGLDDFPTPPWGTRALLRMLEARGRDFRRRSCLEPCANRGYMVRPLRETFEQVGACDLFDYGCGFPVRDFLAPIGADVPEQSLFREADWIFLNPPFNKAMEFVLTALPRARCGVAVLARSALNEGQKRYFTLFSHWPPHYEFPFVERLPMVKGRCDPRASTATAYSWFVWFTDTHAPSFTATLLIPPCRKELERPGDYDPY